MSELKPGWTRVKFGEVVRLVSERCADPLSEGIERYIGLEHLEPGELRVRSWGDVADGVTFTSRVRPGQVLFGKRRAYQRKVAVADFDAVCSGDIYLFESASPQRLLPELLPYICQTDAFFEHAVGTSAGSLSPRTNWTSLASYELALPPIAQQVEAARILELQINLVDALYDFEQEIQNVRTAVGHRYFVGDNAFPLVRLGALIKSNSLSLQTGPFGTVLAAEAYRAEGHPIINPVDMQDGRIVLRNTPCLGDDDWLRLEKYWMKSGDVVLGRKRHMRNLVLVREEHEGYVVGSDSIRLRVDPSVLQPRFFFQLLRSSFAQHWLQAQASGNGTVMPGMNEQILGRLVVRLPDVASQARIAEEIDCLDACELATAHRRSELRLMLRASLSGFLA